MHEGSRRAIVAALVANLGIALANFVAFAFTGAASMLAEAVHPVADTGNQALLILGGARARRAPTEAHPFGYGPERYFWGFVVAIVLETGSFLMARREANLVRGNQSWAAFIRHAKSPELHLGPEELLVPAKLAFDPKLDFAAVSNVIDETERRVRAEVPAARLIFIEPDVDRNPREG